MHSRRNGGSGKLERTEYPPPPTENGTVEEMLHQRCTEKAVCAEIKGTIKIMNKLTFSAQKHHRTSKQVLSPRPQNQTPP